MRVGTLLLIRVGTLLRVGTMALIKASMLLMSSNNADATWDHIINESWDCTVNCGQERWLTRVGRVGKMSLVIRQCLLEVWNYITEQITKYESMRNHPFDISKLGQHMDIN